MHTETDYAAAWLRTNLSDGARLSSEIKQEAFIEGIAERTLWRAKKVIGVRAVKKTTADGPWLWELE